MFRMTCPHYPNFSAEWCRCVADMKKPRMGSTIAYIPFGALIEAAQMRHYHEKLLQLDLVANILTKINIGLATLCVSCVLSNS